MKKSILDHTYDPEPFRRNPQTGSMHLSGKRSWKEVASISFKPILRKVLPAHHPNEFLYSQRTPTADEGLPLHLR